MNSTVLNSPSISSDLPLTWSTKVLPWTHAAVATFSSNTFCASRSGAVVSKPDSPMPTQRTSANSASSLGHEMKLFTMRGWTPTQNRMSTPGTVYLLPRELGNTWLSKIRFTVAIVPELLASILAACKASIGFFLWNRRAMSSRRQWPSATRTGNVQFATGWINWKLRTCCWECSSNWLNRYIWMSHMRIQDGHSSRTTGICTANPCVQLWSHSSSTTRNGDSPKLYRLVVTWLAFCSRSAGLRPNRDASSWRTAWTPRCLCHRPTLLNWWLQFTQMDYSSLLDSLILFMYSHSPFQLRPMIGDLSAIPRLVHSTALPVFTLVSSSLLTLVSFSLRNPLDQVSLTREPLRTKPVEPVFLPVRRHPKNTTARHLLCAVYIQYD